MTRGGPATVEVLAASLLCPVPSVHPAVPNRHPDWWGTKTDWQVKGTASPHLGALSFPGVPCAQCPSPFRCALYAVPCCATQLALAHALECPPAHYTIIALTCLDVLLTVSDLTLSSIWPEHGAAPHEGVWEGWGWLGGGSAEGWRVVVVCRFVWRRLRPFCQAVMQPGPLPLPCDVPALASLRCVPAGACGLYL